MDTHNPDTHIVPRDGKQSTADRYLATLASAGSRDTLYRALERIASLFDMTPRDAPWHAMQPQDLINIRLLLMETYAPATANLHLSALRGVLKQCWIDGLIEEDRYRRLSQIENVKFEQEPAGRFLGRPEVRLLLRECLGRGDVIGIRDAAVIGVLYSGGLRRAELCKLTLADFDREAASFLVRGKGRKQRRVPLANTALDLVLEWLQLRGDDPGFLFCAMRRGDHIYPARRLTPSGVYDMLKRRATAAGIDTLSPHDFRRTFASNLLDAGVDLSLVSKLLGHADPSTTARYDRRPEEAKMHAVKKIDLPI